MFLIVAVIILIIAIVNFVNLSTARSSTRAKEIGVRKIVGSKKSLLIRQFLFESILMSFIAAFFAISLFLYSLPQFNKLMGSYIEIGVLSDFRIIALIVGGVVVLGITSGIYPAICLTSVKPVDVLKIQKLKKTKGLLSRRILIVFQFAASIILIIGTITTDKQLSFIKNKDLGFEKDQILWFPMNKEITENLNVFKNDVLKHPKIEKISVSKYEFGVGGIWGITFNGKEGKVYPMRVDSEYVDLLKLTIIKGRNFSPEIKGDEYAYVLNERAEKEFDQEDLLGKRLPNGDGFGKRRIIGIVKDFHFKSLHQKVPPVALVYYPKPTSNKWTINIKISPKDIKGTIEFLKKTWEEFSPGVPFQFEFLDDTLNKLYKAENAMGKMFTHFSILAILLACLGIFGLAAYTTELRTKEIGIRKVLGSSITGIVFLLSKEFMKWIILANAIAWPIGYLVMNNWLENFAYRWSMTIWIFLVSGILVLIIAILTVSYFSIKAAISDPVDALRYE
ncbi:MAG: FtsX-like permease family protein [Chitinispirillia bacterium]|jgi:putative ABC transport system permease protein